MRSAPADRPRPSTVLSDCAVTSPVSAQVALALAWISPPVTRSVDVLMPLSATARAAFGLLVASRLTPGDEKRPWGDDGCWLSTTRGYRSRETPATGTRESASSPGSG